MLRACPSVPGGVSHSANAGVTRRSTRSTHGANGVAPPPGEGYALSFFFSQ